MTPAQNATRSPRARRGRRAGTEARTSRGGANLGSPTPAAGSRGAPALGARPGRGGRVSGGAAEDAPLTLELSRAQVDRIVRAASGGPSISTVLSGMLASPERLARTLAEFDDTRLSRSLLSGLLVFAAFPTDGGSLGNVEVARMLQMNPSTAHRYISTFLEVGLLERDPGTRRYRLAR
jgi:IclR-like helix-turn-helix domain-containing protein